MKNWVAIGVVLMSLLTGVLTVSAQQDSSQAIQPFPHVGKPCLIRLTQVSGDSGTVKGTILHQSADYVTLSVNEDKDVVWVNTRQIAYIAIEGMGPAAPAR